MYTTVRHVFHHHMIANYQFWWVLVLKFAQAAFVVAITEACQTSVSAQVILKWLHLPWTSRLPAVMHHMTG